MEKNYLFSGFFLSVIKGMKLAAALQHSRVFTVCKFDFRPKIIRPRLLFLLAFHFIRKTVDLSRLPKHPFVKYSRKKLVP